MAGLKLKLDGEAYEVDLNKITLGEGRFLKTQFGVTSYRELDMLDPDPDVIVGVLAVAMRRKHPELDDDEIIKKVEALPNGAYFDQISKQIDAEVKKAMEAEKKDPQPAGANGSQPAAKPGSSGTTPKKRGPARSANAA